MKKISTTVVFVPVFSISEVADILDVHPSTISRAISKGEIAYSTPESNEEGEKEQEKDTKSRKKVTAPELLQYSIKKGYYNEQNVRKEIKARRGADDKSIAKWILEGLDLESVFEELNEESEEE